MDRHCVQDKFQVPNHDLWEAATSGPCLSHQPHLVSHSPSHTRISLHWLLSLPQMPCPNSKAFASNSFLPIRSQPKCHFLCETLCLVAQLCLTLWDPMDCSLPGSSVHWGYSRQEYWSGLPFPPPGDLPNPEPRSPAFQADSLPTELQGKPIISLNTHQNPLRKNTVLLLFLF